MTKHKKIRHISKSLIIILSVFLLLAVAAIPTTLAIIEWNKGNNGGESVSKTYDPNSEEYASLLLNDRSIYDWYAAPFNNDSYVFDSEWFRNQNSASSYYNAFTISDRHYDMVNECYETEEPYVNFSSTKSIKINYSPLTNYQNTIKDKRYIHNSWTQESSFPPPPILRYNNPSYVNYFAGIEGYAYDEYEIGQRHFVDVRFLIPDFSDQTNNIHFYPIRQSFNYWPTFEILFTFEYQSKIKITRYTNDPNRFLSEFGCKFMLSRDDDFMYAYKGVKVYEIFSETGIQPIGRLNKVVINSQFDYTYVSGNWNGSYWTNDWLGVQFPTDELDSYIGRFNYKKRLVKEYIKSKNYKINSFDLVNG